MIIVNIEVAEFTTHGAGLEVEHIGQLIAQGYTSGAGWKASGEEEKEPDDDINQANDMKDANGDMIEISD